MINQMNQVLLKSMASPLLIDGRNMFDPLRVSQIGFQYLGIGRS